MARHIRPGDVAYDIGANMGIHVLLMARLVGDTGHVYAFEPHLPILASLRENVALNDFGPRVTIVGLAVSDRVGRESFHTAHHSGAGHLAGAGAQSGERIDVETTTLDEFVVRLGNRPPTFIKMDVEGAEGSVLSGGLGTLETHRPILLVDLHNPNQDLEVGRVLRQFDYVAFRTADGSEVQDLERGWPDPTGISGQVIGFPRDKAPAGIRF